MGWHFPYLYADPPENRGGSALTCFALVHPFELLTVVEAQYEAEIDMDTFSRTPAS
jgi:hypothetical protein